MLLVSLSVILRFCFFSFGLFLRLLGGLAGFVFWVDLGFVMITYADCVLLSLLRFKVDWWVLDSGSIWGHFLLINIFWVSLGFEVVGWMVGFCYFLANYLTLPVPHVRGGWFRSLRGTKL